MTLPSETTAKLLALPSLREQAERDARELYAVAGGSWDAALQLNPSVPKNLIRHQAELLANLTRWQSQAWAGKVIAQSLGYARDIARVYLKTYPNGNAAWILAIGEGEYDFRERHLWSPAFKGFSVGRLPEVDTDETRPAAIAAILLHLEARDGR